MHAFQSNPNSRANRRGHRSRRGSVYVAVIGVAMIASMVGVAALHIERVNLKSAAGRERQSLAQLAANSAVELAIARIKADANWRTTYTHNVEVPSASWTPLGTNANMKFVLSDPDASLSNDTKDAVIIKGIGSSGDATCVHTVTLECGRPGLDCLDFAVHSAGRLDVGNASTMTADTVSSNTRIEVNPGVLGLLLASSINGDAWCTGSINGGVTGTKYTNQSPAREMPDASVTTTSVFSYYVSVGTWIDINSIPNKRIENVVLSAKNNPYGAANPQGIYLIDCKDQLLRIRNARINATLVLISATQTPILSGALNWEPAAPNYPALMIWGNLDMSWSGGTVVSETTLNTNFNPVGTPYLTSEDADKLDLYPGIIKGLVYTTGNVDISSVCVMEGNLVAGGTLGSSANVTVTYGAYARDYPPPGFGKGGEMRVVPGSWRRTTR